MNEVKLIDAIEQLEAKLKKGKKHFLYDCGICENLSVIGKRFYHFQIKELSQQWKNFSGDSTYPIGGMQEYNQHKEYETLWQGEQLKLRMDFIKFMKNKLKKQLL